MPKAQQAPPETPSVRREIGYVATVTDGEVKGVVIITTKTPSLFEIEGFSAAVENSAAGQLATSTVADAQRLASRRLMELYGAIQTELKNLGGEKVPPFQVVDFKIVE